MLKDTFLFDLDGTLIDSDSLHEEAYRGALLKHRPDLLENFSFEKIKGLTTEDSIFILGGILDFEELVKEKRNLYLLSISKSKLLPGAVQLLEHLKESGFNLCLVTGAHKSVVEQISNITGLDRYFTKVVTAEDAIRNKPCPDLYNYAIKAFGFDKNKCIAVEDSTAGYTAAIEAEIDCIFVDKFFTLESLYEHMRRCSLCG